MEHKEFSVELKSIDESTGSFELYCAVFGNVDFQNDVILPGAFKNLQDFVVTGWLAFMHDVRALPLALIDTATQDSHGLKITGRFHSTFSAQECRKVMQERLAAGKKVRCSFGYRVIDAAMELRNGEAVRLLKALEIYEASIVNMAANELAGVTRVKSTDNLIGLKAVEGFIEELKAGRVFSSANHSKLKEWADGLIAHGKSAHAMGKSLKQFLAQHGPVDDDEEEDEPPEDDEGDEEAAEKNKDKKSDEGSPQFDRTSALKRRRLTLRAAILKTRVRSVS